MRKHLVLILTLAACSFAQISTPPGSSGTGASSQNVQGAGAAAATTVGKPVLAGCAFETTPTTVSTGQTNNVHCDSSGRPIVVGQAAVGAAAAGNPVYISGTDQSGNIISFRLANVGGAGILAASNAPSTPVDGVSNTSATYFPLMANATTPTIGPSVITWWFNGSTWDRAFYCSSKAKLNALAAATTQIVALSGATKIRVCSAVISNNNATATTLKMVEGTGANCGTGQTDTTALMNIGATSTAPVSLQWGPGSAVTTTTGGDALCFTSSAASSLEIEITYAQF